MTPILDTVVVVVVAVMAAAPFKAVAFPVTFDNPMASMAIDAVARVQNPGYGWENGPYGRYGSQDQAEDGLANGIFNNQGWRSTAYFSPSSSADGVISPVENDGELAVDDFSADFPADLSADVSADFPADLPAGFPADARLRRKRQSTATEGFQMAGMVLDVLGKAVGIVMPLVSMGINMAMVGGGGGGAGGGGAQMGFGG